MHKADNFVTEAQKNKGGFFGPLKTIYSLVVGFPPLAFLIKLQMKASSDYVGLVAAGIAYYFLLASFPAIAALISIYGLISDPREITEQFNSFSRFLPREAFEILISQAQSVASAHESALSMGVIFGILLALLSASKGVDALIKGLNIAFGNREKRNVVTLTATSYTLTFLMLYGFVFMIILLAAVPFAIHFLPIGESYQTTLELVRWPLLFAMCMVGLEAIYYFGPCHKRLKWHWVSWGSFTATILWICLAMIFSGLVAKLTNFNETYGSLGAVIILMFWFWVSAMTIMYGAEVNALLVQRRKEHMEPNAR